MERVRIKICGITRPEDAISAAQAGVDAIGLVFYEKSPRRVDAVTAMAIIKSLPPFICKVGLFVDADADTVLAILREVPLDLLQFHGNEPSGYCRGFGKPYLKAVRMRAGLDIGEVEKNHHEAVALLLDTHVVDSAGGTGQTFAWELIPMGLRKPVILAGGLDAGNVGKAIRQAHPYAVDVSSGVESAKGIKDMRKIAAFVRAVGDASLPA